MSIGDIIGISIILHLIGDYLLQSHWMAVNKRTSFSVCTLHAGVYVLPFSVVTQSPIALAIIMWTHLVIDHWSLARYVIYYKNKYLSPRTAHRWTFEECRQTGFPPDTPAWLSTWLLIIVDNTLHLIINISALTWTLHHGG